MLKEYIKPKVAIFVDMSNLFHASKRYSKWFIDYEKLREYLKDKYDIQFFRLYGCEDTNSSSGLFKEKAKKQQEFYKKLTRIGFDIFKRPIQYIDGRIDGDVDDDIIRAIRQYAQFDNIEYIVLFSGDKHFLPVIKECCSIGKHIDIYSFKQTLSKKIKKFCFANCKKCNFLYLNKKRKELEYKKKV